MILRKIFLNKIIGILLTCSIFSLLLIVLNVRTYDGCAIFLLLGFIMTSIRAWLKDSTFQISFKKLLTVYLINYLVLLLVLYSFIETFTPLLSKGTESLQGDRFWSENAKLWLAFVLGFSIDIIWNSFRIAEMVVYEKLKKLTN